MCNKLSEVKYEIIEKHVVKDEDYILYSFCIAKNVADNKLGVLTKAPGFGDEKFILIKFIFDSIRVVNDMKDKYFAFIVEQNKKFLTPKWFASSII